MLKKIQQIKNKNKTFRMYNKRRRLRCKGKLITIISYTILMYKPKQSFCNKNDFTFFFFICVFFEDLTQEVTKKTK